ncbi:hypothetical protein O6H91_01G163300 [Diphasiastrum complanatum]|uniref:Uncharacterized protein n=10 Tax=Diphasiastrum complanatum TaxID=34168 RepID=A0ACC2EY34_DIPCM|nr:hypothetical protein O6H91_01G163300 [Diphasiastrum complanatum]KAJ7571442.1 hypothetical protein O6H91_01G163300 [Diphasiastrum complanatum]
MDVLYPFLYAFRSFVMLLVGTFVAVLIYDYTHKRRERNRPRLPPGPHPWPIVGNLLQVGALPHCGMMNLTKIYGPVVYLQLGNVPAVVTDDPSFVKEILKKQDHVFASRPKNIASEYFTYRNKDIAFAPYGSHWRKMRKICTMELLTPKRLDYFQQGRIEEAQCLVRSIMEDHKLNKPINLRDKLGALSSNNLTRMLLGKRFFGPGNAGPEDAAEYKKMIYEAFSLVNSFNMADYLPFLRPLDLQGHERRMQKIMKRSDEIYEAILAEHRKRGRKGLNETNTFIDVLLSLPGENGQECLCDETIKAIIGDMVAAGTDTSSITSEWTLAELMQHPEIMHKVRNEIDGVVGYERVVEESDLDQFQYLRAVLKEVFRLHPVGAFLIPHVAIDDAEIAGRYHIPKNTRILINTYSLGRNPASWNRPLEFRPDRFLEKHVDLFDPEYRIVPFGAGRRGCPGASLGTSMVLLGLSRLIHSFEWSPPHGKSVKDIPMIQAFNSMILDEPLHLIATPRLKASLY